MKENRITVRPVFILGSNPSFLRDDELGFRDVGDEAEQEERTDEILRQLRMDMEPKILVRREEDFLRIDTEADAFIVFVHCSDRFRSLVALADTGIPLILTGEKGSPGDALDAFEPLAGRDNVKVAFGFEELKGNLSALRATRWVTRAKVCVFDRGEHLLEDFVWHKNPLLRDKLNVHCIDVVDFENRYNEVDEVEAEGLARKWMGECEVREPTLEDVARSARLYIAMRGIIEEREGDAAYVLWCGQFTKMLGTKMCFAIAKLNDAGCLTGCWRGENLLPMLIAHALSEKHVFFGEVHTYRDGILSLRHCAVPTNMASSAPVLRRWRRREGTVAGYCELPRGEVTLVNAGIGDRVVAMRGDVVESRDLGGDNCRTTIWIKVDEEAIRNVVGREFAMVYGDYVDEVREVGRMLGIDVP